MPKPRWDRLWHNVHLATMQPGTPYGAIPDGALAVQGERIAWLGAAIDLPDDWTRETAEIIDGEGGWLTPGLIDCHTHLVYGGNRVDEFELRLNGASYEEIARAGGGIYATVAASRAASEADLYQQSLRRLRCLLAEGVTTVEIKSGYGLDLGNERKLLRVARRLGQTQPVTVVTTFLAAHAVAPEYHDCADDYITHICEGMLPSLVEEKLVDAVDAFCERIAFTPAQVERVFIAAKERGLPVKLHAGQLSDQGGAALAAHYQALSADHLEYLSEAGAQALAAAGTVAVLLPGAFYTLRENQRPPIDTLRRLGVPLAVATDCNPGTSPLCSLLMAMNMACILFRLTPAEALGGVTREAARALGRQHEVGTLVVGQRADLALWDITRPAELAYSPGYNPLRQRVYGGILVC